MFVQAMRTYIGGRPAEKIQPQNFEATPKQSKTADAACGIEIVVDSTAVVDEECIYEESMILSDIAEFTIAIPQCYE